MTFQLISDNSSFFEASTLQLSTVEMPKITGFDLGYQYESCLFAGRGSEVVGRYQTLSEAIAGHNILAKKFDLQ